MNFFQANNPHFYIAIIIAVLNSALLTYLSSKFMQVIQQSGYKIKGYMTWLRGTRYKYLSRLFTLGLLSFFCALVSNTLLDVYHSETLYSYIGLIFYFYFSAVLIINLVKEENKIPLVKTKRIGRWFSMLFILYFALSFFMIALSTEYILILRFAIITITPALVPFVVILGFYFVLPLELLINKSYIVKAKRKLKKAKNLKIVAITGSYGKTSNKFILKEMLKTQFEVVVSPSSFNTPLGLTRTILNDLEDKHEFFIAEFGAKKQGEIKELCQMIKPNYGLITGVGSQHLETFKDIEKIKKTKFELAEYITQEHFGFNGDNNLAKELFESYDNPKKFVTYAKDEKGFCYCKDIKLSHKGTNFTLVVAGNEIKTKTKLLGAFNLENIALCAGLAFKLGIRLESLAKAIESLEPVKHRMQIVSQDKNYVIIDDSFNASVEGSKAAIDTLELFKGYTKIVVTPGIVEMGKLETDANFNLGEQIAKVCDYAIIVNEINKDALYKGMLSQNMKKKNIFICENLKEATDKIENLKQEKTVVLFENDLPDLFVY